MQKFKGYCAGAILLVWTAVPATGQRGRDSYYNGMNDRVRRGDYNRYSEDDNRRHHHDDRGGIGPGKAALIGGGGGALLGAVFGGGLKGSLIGGAAGAGIGALGESLAQRNDRRDGDRRR